MEASPERLASGCARQMWDCDREVVREGVCAEETGAGSTVERKEWRRCRTYELRTAYPPGWPQSTEVEQLSWPRTV